MPTPTAAPSPASAPLQSVSARLQSEGEDLFDDLPQDVLDRLPDDVIDDLKNDVIDEIPQEVVDRLPEGVADLIPDSFLAGGPSTTFIGILIAAAAIGVIGFLWGMAKSAMKAALFFAVVAVVAAVILFAS